MVYPSLTLFPSVAKPVGPAVGLLSESFKEDVSLGSEHAWEAWRGQAVHVTGLETPFAQTWGRFPGGCAVQPWAVATGGRVLGEEKAASIDPVGWTQTLASMGPAGRGGG